MVANTTSDPHIFAGTTNLRSFSNMTTNISMVIKKLLHLARATNLQKCAHTKTNPLRVTTTTNLHEFTYIKTNLLRFTRMYIIVLIQQLQLYFISLPLVLLMNQGIRKTDQKLSKSKFRCCLYPVSDRYDLLTSLVKRVYCSH